MFERGLAIAESQLSRAGQCQSFRVVGVQLQRLLDKRHGLAFKAPLLRHNGDIRVVGKQLRVGWQQLGGALIRGHGLRIAPQRALRTCQQYPALGVGRVLLHLLRERVDHGQNLLVGNRRIGTSCGTHHRMRRHFPGPTCHNGAARTQSLRRTNRGIDDEHGGREQDAHCAHQQPRALRTP